MQEYLTHTHITPYILWSACRAISVSTKGKRAHARQNSLRNDSLCAVNKNDNTKIVEQQLRLPPVRSHDAAGQLGEPHARTYGGAVGAFRLYATMTPCGPSPRVCNMHAVLRGRPVVRQERRYRSQHMDYRVAKHGHIRCGRSGTVSRALTWMQP